MKNFQVNNLEMRRKGVGGSEAGAAIGVNEYKSPFQLWLEKTGRANPPDLSDNLNVKRGIRMEPIIRQWVKEDLGITIHKDNQTHYSPDHPFLYSHTDGWVVGKKRIAEIKAPSIHMIDRYGEEGTDQIPDYNLAQGVHMLAVQPEMMGVDYFVQFPGHEIKQYVLEREESLVESYIASVTRFWGFVEHDTPPPPINSEDINKMYGTSNKQMLSHDMPLEVKIQSLISQNKAIKEAKDIQKSLSIEIKNAIGHYDGYTMSSGKRATLSRVLRSTFNESRMLEEADPLYDEYCRAFDEKLYKHDHPDSYKYYSDEAISMRLVLPR
jgi:putative phage-type endonuclease